MNKIKMVITDLDGTFLNNEEIVSQRKDVYKRQR